MVVKVQRGEAAYRAMHSDLYVGQRIVRGWAKREAENNSIRTIGTHVAHKSAQTDTYSLYETCKVLLDTHK